MEKCVYSYVYLALLYRGIQLPRKYVMITYVRGDLHYLGHVGYQRVEFQQNLELPAGNLFQLFLLWWSYRR